MVYARVHNRTVTEDYYTAMEVVEKRLKVVPPETEDKAHPPVGDDERTHLLELAKSQYHFKEIIRPYLRDLDFSRDARHIALRWWPLPDSRLVVVDPLRSFGKPILAKEGVPTEVLMEGHREGRPVDELAKWFDVEPEGVVAAITFEEQLAA